MNVGIFGDSYGDDRTGELGHKSWVKLLSEKYNVTNYSYTGSGLFYSYDLFEKNHHKHEKIIFLVSDPDRILMPSHTKLDVSSHLTYNQCRVFAEKINKDYELVVDYFEQIHNSDFYRTSHKLMVDNIPNIRKDAIVYPCFEFSYLNKFPLFHVTRFEDNFIGMNPEKRVELYNKGLRDSRTCHMTEKNNYVVYQMFDSLLNHKDFELSESILHKPEHSLEYYYQSKFMDKIRN